MADPIRWGLLHGHSHFSLLDGLGKPDKIAQRCASYGYSAVALTDHGNVGGMVDHWKAMQAVGIKPIAGCELYLCKESATIKGSENTRPYSHLPVLAKNKAGWQQLIQAVSASNRKDHFYYHPRLHLEELRDYTVGGNLIAFSGHPGSDLANCMFYSPKEAYRCTDYDHCKTVHVRSDWRQQLLSIAEAYISVFGRENFRLEAQILDPVMMPASLIVARALRWLGAKLKIAVIATYDSHYVDRVDAHDQRILLCSKLRTTLSAIQRRIDADEEVELSGFFKGDHFHIPSPDDLLRQNTPDEIEAAWQVAQMCEAYDILSTPKIPHAFTPEGLDEKMHLRQLCEQGFRDILEQGRGSRRFELTDYRDRLAMELQVLEDAGLSGYFLIVRECTDYGRSRGWLLGPGRGSSAGCLVSYLTRITTVDPLEYDRYFERFYNAGRNQPGKISLPDVDLDFPVIKREEIFRFLQQRYGKDRVAKIATFNTLQGRSALDEVLAAHEVGFEIRKQITKIIPDKARISEELQEMADAGEEPSIIAYSLDIYGDELRDWVTLREDGTLSGPYARYFEQAIRLEGVKKNISTHAAGVVISSEPLATLCPLTYDEATDCYQAAMEYPALEAMGLLKVDILGVAMLNKGEGVRDLFRTGRINPDVAEVGSYAVSDDSD